MTSQTNTWAGHGRGLHLVDRLSEAWGWEGKLGRSSTVWANLAPYAPIPDTVQA